MLFISHLVYSIPLYLAFCLKWCQRPIFIAQARSLTKVEVAIVGCTCPCNHTCSLWLWNAVLNLRNISWWHFQWNWYYSTTFSILFFYKKCFTPNFSTIFHTILYSQGAWFYTIEQRMDNENNLPSTLVSYGFLYHMDNYFKASTFCVCGKNSCFCKK